jgi:hypothetical protein
MYRYDPWHSNSDEERRIHEWNRQQRAQGEPSHTNFEEEPHKAYSTTLWIITISLSIFFLVDIYNTRIIHLHQFISIAFLAYTIPSVIFLILSIFKPFRYYLKPSISVIAISFLTTMMVIGFLPESIGNAPLPIKLNKTGRVVTQTVYDSSLRFDTGELNLEKNNWHNFGVACEYLKSFKTTDIKKAQKVTVEEIYKHLWKYIGKLVYLTIKVEQPNELPPSDSVSMALNPGGPTTVIVTQISIGGMGDAIQYHYGGPFEGFDAGDKVDICGYVVGRGTVTNRSGGESHNILVVGKYIKEHPK